MVSTRLVREDQFKVRPRISGLNAVMHQEKKVTANADLTIVRALLALFCPYPCFGSSEERVRGIGGVTHAGRFRNGRVGSQRVVTWSGMDCERPRFWRSWRPCWSIKVETLCLWATVTTPSGLISGLARLSWRRFLRAIHWRRGVSSRWRWRRGKT